MKNHPKSKLGIDWEPRDSQGGGRWGYGATIAGYFVIIHTGGWPDKNRCVVSIDVLSYQGWYEDFFGAEIGALETLEDLINKKLEISRVYLKKEEQNLDEVKKILVNDG